MKAETKLDYYQLLGIAPNAKLAEIRRAYKRAAKKAHPDKGGSSEAFIEIKRAHDTLVDPRRRKEYNLGQRQGIDPREFKQILEQQVHEIVDSALVLLEVEGGYGNLLRTCEKLIEKQRKELLGAKKECGNKQQFLERQIRSIKKGKDAYIAQNLQKMKKKLDSTMQTLEHRHVVLDFLLADSRQMFIEDMMPPPGMEAKRNRAQRESDIIDALSAVLGTRR